MKLEVRHYAVDFRKPPETRWDGLLQDPWACHQALKLCDAIYRDRASKLGIATSTVSLLAAKAGSTFSWLGQGELDFLDDMRVWSDWAVGSFDEVLLANYSYELHQTGSPPVALWNGIRSRIGLCTSAAFHRPGIGMVHCRNMDWPIPAIRKATVILHCKSQAGPFKSVAVPGMVGVLSGVAKGRFSITINSKEDRNHWVPNPRGWGAQLLVRWILEYCDDWDEALRELQGAPAFVPFYATLVGCKKGQAVVVEVNRNGDNRVYECEDLPVAVANHYPGEIYEYEDMDSQQRQELIERLAKRCRAKTLPGCFAVLNKAPVWNTNTVQSMVLHPRSGTILLQATRPVRKP